MNRATVALLVMLNWLFSLSKEPIGRLMTKMVLNKLKSLRCPVLLAINKVDNVTDKNKLLPHIGFKSTNGFSRCGADWC